jgi:hypothetical protein
MRRALFRKKKLKIPVCNIAIELPGVKTSNGQEVLWRKACGQRTLSVPNIFKLAY